MLSPVAAVSSASSVVPTREVVAPTGTLTSQPTQPDGSVALSLAVSAGVEGKLNMLLINARERMVDSLFAVIDAVSQSLALQPKTGESNTGYALRLADTIADLPPKQLAVVQQQLTAQGQTAPLALVAAALHDPTGAEAAQLVAYLEVVRYKDKDLATKSVVASYGLNDGSTGQETVGEETSARNTAAQAAATIGQTATAPLAPSTAKATPLPVVSAALPEPLSDETSEPLSTANAPPEEPAAPSPQAQQNSALSAASNQPAAARAAAAQVLQTVSGEIAAETSDPVATAEPSPANTDEATPRVILQIRSDIKEGLKLVFDRLVVATGAELLQTMAEVEPLADKVIAQALVADMIDGAELQHLPLPDAGTAAQRTTAPNTALPVPVTAAAEETAQAAAITQMTADAEPAEAVVPQQAPVVPPGLVVGFVTTPYAPAETIIKDKDPMRIDRVDAVDDDEHEEPGGRQRQAEEEDEPETPAEEALDMLEAGAESPFMPESSPNESRSSLIALPRPMPAEPLPNPGYNLYERMGA